MFHTKTRIIVAIVASVVVLGGALIASGHATFIFKNSVLSFTRNATGSEGEPVAGTQKSKPLASQGGDAVQGNEQGGGQAAAAPMGTTTETFFNDFLHAYQTQQALGGQLPTSTTQDLAGSFSEKLQSSDIDRTYEFYARSDLTVAANTQEANNVYRNRLSSLVETYRTNYSADEMELVQEAAATRDQEKVVTLREYANAYHEFAQKLSNVNVPEHVTEAHLSMTNAYFMLGQAVNNMASVLQDPLRALIGIAQYKRAQVQLIQSADAIYQAEQ